MKLVLDMDEAMTLYVSKDHMHIKGHTDVQTYRAIFPALLGRHNLVIPVTPIMAIQSRLRTLLLSAFFILYPSIVEYAHALTDWSISDVSECGSLDVTFTGRNGTIIMFIVPVNINSPHLSPSREIDLCCAFI